MKMFKSAEEEMQITKQLSTLLRNALSKQPKLTKKDVVAYTSYGNAMMVVHTHDFHCAQEMMAMVEHLKELVPAIDKTDCTEAGRMVDIMIAHLEERITDETFKCRH